MVKKCSACKGIGIIKCGCLDEYGKVSAKDDCLNCDGKGKRECPICGGGGWVSEQNTS